MDLVLHRGAKPIEYGALRELETPEPTATHHPIPHYLVSDLVKHSLTFYGHTVTGEQYGVTEDGARFFGVIMLKSEYGDYTDICGLRNSHDKTFPTGIAVGSRVFVCDNLSFLGDQVVRRKHTQKLRFELPGLIAAMVEPLAEQRKLQHHTFERYKQAQLTDERADHGIMQLYRKGVINLQRIADVAEQWDQPKFEEWGDRTAYRLFNAATYALTGRVMDDATATPRLHRVIEGLCREIN